MVAIEFLADIAVGEVKELSAQVDGDLSRSHNGLRIALGLPCRYGSL